MIIKYLVSNIDKFNVTELCNQCGIQRGRMQRCLVQGSWKDDELEKINQYFKTIANDITKVYNEG